MTTVRQLLAGVGDALSLVAGPLDGADVTHVALVDVLEELPQRSHGALALLTGRASAEATGYRLDVVLRLGADAGLAAIAAVGAARAGAPTTRLAERAGVALLDRRAGTDVGDLLIRADRVLRPDASAQLARLVDLHALLEAADVEAGLAAAASRILGVDLRLVDDDPAGAAIVVDDRPAGAVVVGGDGPAGRLAGRLVADRVARLRERDRRADEVGARTRSRLVVDLLGGSEARVEAAAEQARAGGLELDRRHRVLRVEPAADASGPVDGGALGDAARITTALVRRERGWLVAAGEDGVVAIRTVAPDEPADAAAVVAAARQVLDRLATAWPDVPFVAGVGGAHLGVDGLRTSDAEARAAASGARAAGRPGQVAVHDATGVGRAIAEWAATPTARRVIDDVLAPLDALGASRAEVAVETLRAYLDERGSLVAAGRRLHLHPNAVAYRLRRIRRLLEVDVDEAEGRLVLQLACHARLGPGGTTRPGA